MTAADAHRAILAVWRIEQPRPITSLARILRDVPLAEDLTQDIFLKIFKSLNTFDRRANFQTWLISISRNLCIDHYRSVRKERETIDRDQFERLLAGEDESTVFPEAEVVPELPSPAEEPKRERQPGRQRPFPLPGATMQPPPPDPAKG